jgi:hypothetical protein
MMSFSSRISFLDDLSIGDRGISFSNYHCVWVCIEFKSFSVCSMKLGALTLVSYKVIIVISP